MADDPRNRSQQSVINDAPKRLARRVVHNGVVKRRNTCRIACSAVYWMTYEVQVIRRKMDCIDKCMPCHAMQWCDAKTAVTPLVIPDSVIPDKDSGDVPLHSTEWSNSKRCACICQGE